MAPKYALKTLLYVVSKVFVQGHNILTRLQAIQSVFGEERRAAASADFDAFIEVWSGYSRIVRSLTRYRLY